jgi:hypothetical protein
MKKFLIRGSKKGDGKNKPDSSRGDVEKEDTFPEETCYFMIFSGLVAYDSKR